MANELAPTFPENKQPENRLAPILNQIRAMPNPESQFLALDMSHSPYAKGKLPRDLTPEESQDLLDFAADPSSSTSLLVRALALEDAIKSISSKYSPYSAEHSVIRENLGDLLGPEAFETVKAMRTGWPRIPRYNYIAHFLAEKEGITTEYLFPDYSGYGEGNSGEWEDPYPATALHLLHRIVELRDSPHRLPVTRFTSLVPLALGIQGAMAEAHDDEVSDFSGVQAEIAEIEAFLNRGNEETLPYREALEKLRQVDAKVGEIFPAEFAEQVRSGTQKLVANCLYAIRAHLENDKDTDIELPLEWNPSAGLSLKLKGDEPLSLLEYLHSSIAALHELAGATNLDRVTTISGRGYHIFELNVRGENAPKAYVYVRPRPDKACDPRNEYGREGKGVEASINFVIDMGLEPDQPIEIGPHQGSRPDSRLSIRLDREGLGDANKAELDPTSQSARLALDIGSIIGNEEWVSTKLGRFIAWGNILRSNANKVAPNLNHSREYFQDEDAELHRFAAVANTTADRYSKLAQTTTSNATLSSGKLAVRGLK